MDFLSKERPYYTVNDFYQAKFKEKVIKIPLSGPFSCPNRDGTLGWGGCTYCTEKGAGEFAGNPLVSLSEQYEKGLALLRKKWPSGKTIVYFQANTNTYAPVATLKSLFSEALQLSPEIVGLSLATRPDCLPLDVLDYLGKLNQKTFLTVEVGLQTMHEITAKKINRGHDLQAFVQAITELSKRQIHTVVHIINSLPGETNEMMLDTIRFLNTLPINGLKIHMLYLVKGSQLGRDYLAHPFPLLSLSDYVDITSSQIELLRPDIILYRLTGDPVKADLIAPLWTLKKFVVTNEIDKRLRQNSSFQGARWTK
ncbi:MAG: TIGR01212 family radical SAM protein [Candidatus Izemoplasmatales bacterium]|jgi:hypothetical protein|nr:TIGR01212 family radical SAM protein [Candidatus Izemoplasmatales bacterium]MDD5601916.1 TIGR01212 family radical SAM protein [Candidatus Izemoplasmatales bacterium]